MNIVENIVSVFDRATNEEVEHGLSWYLDANRIALDVGKGDLKLGAGLLAVLSPRLKWNKNVEYAYHAVEYGWPYPGMSAITNKVIRLLEGESADTVVNGEKTVSFYRNIVNPFSDDVTVDRHAIDIALATRHNDDTRPSLSKSRYEELANAYRDAAKRCSIFPLELQAITWVAWRREVGIV